MRRSLVLVIVALVSICVGTPPALAAKQKPTVLIQTVPKGKDNTFFEVTSTWFPQTAQTLTVTKPMVWTAIRMRTVQLKLTKSPDVVQWLNEGRYDENWFTSIRQGRSITADTTLEVWRSDTPEPLPDVIDLSTGFTRVHQSQAMRSIPIGREATFPVPNALAVTPGRYVVVLGFRFQDPRVFNLRFAGQENGDNMLGGYNHDHPISPECGRYVKSQDANPGGRAYRPRNEGPLDPVTLTVPFTTTFEVAETKVPMSCDMTGVYDPNLQIWNPGDLQMTILGRRGSW